MKNSTKILLRGVKDIFPALIGITPFGIVLGFAMKDAGFSGVQSAFNSFSLLAGAAQLAAIQLYTSLTPGFIIILTVIIINLRYSMYSLSFRPVMENKSFSERLFASFLLTDLAYGYIMTEFEKRPKDPSLPLLYFGAAAVIYLTRLAGIFLGYSLGAIFSTKGFFDFVIPLIFMSLLVPHLGGRDRQLAAISSALSAVILVPVLPLKTGLLVSIIIGIATGIACKTYLDSKRSN